MVILVVFEGAEGEAGEQGHSAVAHEVVLGQHSDWTIPEMSPQLLGLATGHSFGRTQTEFVQFVYAHVESEQGLVIM